MGAVIPPKTKVDKNGSLVGTRPEINLIEGTGVSLTVADNSGSNRVDVTINNTGVVATGVTLDGGGATIATGTYGTIVIPFACTINSASLTADASGSIVIDIKKSTYSGYPSTSSICASALPTLSSAQKSQDTTLTGWTTSIAAGDVLQYVVNSATTVQRVTLTLKVTRT